MCTCCVVTVISTVCPIITGLLCLLASCLLCPSSLFSPSPPPTSTSAQFYFGSHRKGRKEVTEISCRGGAYARWPTCDLSVPLLVTLLVSNQIGCDLTNNVPPRPFFFFFFLTKEGNCFGGNLQPRLCERCERYSVRTPLSRYACMCTLVRSKCSGV